MIKKLFLTILLFSFTHTKEVIFYTPNKKEIGRIAYENKDLLLKNAQILHVTTGILGSRLNQQTMQKYADAIHDTLAQAKIDKKSKSEFVDMSPLENIYDSLHTKREYFWDLQNPWLMFVVGTGVGAMGTLFIGRFIEMQKYRYYYSNDIPRG